MHAFISYVVEDREQVLEIKNYLESKGITVWLDKYNLKPGKRWKNEIRKAIKSGSCFIACFSENYCRRDKTYMNEELIIAIEELRLRSTEQAWFIPVKLSDCHVPEINIGAGAYLQDLQWVALYEDFSLGLRRIAEAILPLSEKDSIKDLLNYLKSPDNDIVISALALLKKEAKLSEPRIMRELLLAAANNTSECAKEQIIMSINDSNNLMQMIATMILELPDDQVNKKLVEMLAKKCSTEVFSEYPQIYEKFKNSLLFDSRKLLRPYSTWDFTEEKYQKVKNRPREAWNLSDEEYLKVEGRPSFTWHLSPEEYTKVKNLYEETKPGIQYLNLGYREYDFSLCVSTLEDCPSCNRKLLMQTSCEECYDSGDWWFRKSYNCAWCGYYEQRNDDARTS